MIFISGRKRINVCIHEHALIHACVRVSTFCNIPPPPNIDVGLANFAFPPTPSPNIETLPAPMPWNGQ